METLLRDWIAVVERMDGQERTYDQEVILFYDLDVMIKRARAWGRDNPPKTLN